MGDNSSENYLDNLLESISEIDNSRKTEIDFIPENIFGDNPFGKKEEPESLFKDNPFEEPDNILEQEKKRKLSSDDEFLREFEKELESDAYKDYFSDFEAELEEEQNRDLEISTERKGIPDDLDPILRGLEENSKEVEPVPAMPDPRTESAEEILNSMEKKGAAGRKPGPDHPGDISGMEEPGDTGEAIPAEEPLAMTETGEPDLAGVGDADLIELLAKVDGLSDLGDILQNSESDTPLDEEDAIGKYAEDEMNPQKQEQTEEKGRKRKRESSKGSKEKPADGGVLNKLKILFFGDDEEDEPDIKEKAKTPPKNTAEELADENAQILAELEQEENASSEKEKKKKEKVKKEKAKKTPKEKKPKKVKAPKPKKEKKPKEKDNTPPLPKKPVILIFLMVISFVALVMIGTSLLNYSADFSLAKEMYRQGSYCEGYERLQGQKVKEKDETFYEQLKVLATVDSQYQSYLVFLMNGQQARALDCLVCAAGRYDLNMEKAVEYECEQEYNALGESIANACAGYDMTLEEAIMIYNQPNRIEYTKALEEKISSLGLE